MKAVARTLAALVLGLGFTVWLAAVILAEDGVFVAGCMLASVTVGLAIGVLVAAPELS